MNASLTNSNLSSAALDELCVNTLRFLSVDMIEAASSGHPGLPLGAAPMAYVLWTRFLKHQPGNPHWFDRDRFVLSAGHGSALLYSLLHLSGYDLPLEQLKQFRQWGSSTPGHPERGLTPGVEVTTGPLGQGFGNGVGMAIMEANLAARYNRDGFTMLDHFTYGLVSDGDLMEGIASEAASLAGHLQLGKLIYLYDDNATTLSAGTGMTFTEHCAQRFDAYGWQTLSIEDGNDLAAIEQALVAARLETRRPSLLLVRSRLGYGSPNRQDTFQAHGAPLGAKETQLTKRNLGWPEQPLFHVPDAVRRHFLDIKQRAEQREAQWRASFASYAQHFPALAGQLQQLFDQAMLPAGWDAALPEFAADAKGMATRVAGGKVMNALAARLPALIGGSADLDPSTYTALKDLGDYQAPGIEAGNRQGSSGGGWSHAGRNLHFGVREHAMAAISNGMAAHGGALPFCATFLTFSDYMRPSIRLAALMGLHVVYVFTHDSLALGEDGPTHQAVEQLASLRALPGFDVIRPCDANETAWAWRVAVATARPVALVLTRQEVPTLERTQYASAEGLRYGAYVLHDAPSGQPELILIASGSEVALIVSAQQQLLKEHIAVRLVSMPSWELFERQPQQYRDSVLAPEVPARLAVEAGVSQGWHRYVGQHGEVIGVDGFGASAAGPVVMREYGFTVDNVCQKARALLLALR